MASSTSRKIRLGLVGLGAAGRAFLPAALAHPHFELTAIAEPDERVRSEIAGQTGTTAFADLPAMLTGAELDAIYIGTPTELHDQHAALAFAARKHVLTEKPMAPSLERAQAMVSRAEQAGVLMLVGHSHSYDLPIQAMRGIIGSGELGRVRMIQNWCFTDWVYRPRRPDELDTDQGGGVIYRQGAHQFDIIRLLGGGLLKSVRAVTFDWDAQRKTVGAHVVLLQFTDGTAATAVYNGYGYLMSSELCFDVGEWGLPQGEDQRPAATARMTSSPADELAAKRERAKNAIPAQAPFQPFFGLTVVSCERGDLRQSPRGLFVYTNEGRKEIVLPTDRSPRALVLDEFADAILGKAPAIHDGRWGLASLEVSAAAISSARDGQEIELRYQVAAPPLTSFRMATSERAAANV
jgi:phthalate 4,5-cis-dihydrodiol dehydrogenase